MARARCAAMLALAVMSSAAACGTLSAAPLGNGDRVVGDVDATTLPPQPTAAVSPDSPFAPVDGSTSYGPEYDAYASLTICGSARVPNGSADSAVPPAMSPGADAAALPSYEDGASAPASCEPLPAACANEPDCECLLRVLAAKIACPYPHCTVGGGFKMYCP